MIEITYHCSGCEAEATVGQLRQTFKPLSAAGSHWCVKQTPTIESAAPEGWVAFDPYTGCCYCPECWAGITAPKENAAA